MRTRAAILFACLAAWSPWLAVASDSVRHADGDIHLSGDDGNGDPAGIWSDGDTVWVADTLDNRLYAYRLATGERDAARDFDTLADYTPAGLWSDGATLWVLDYYDGDAAAYDLATGGRRAAEDVRNIGREQAGGLWSDGRTLWIAHTGDDELRAHGRRDGARDGARDFDTLAAAGNDYVTGLWSDGVTMWVADHADGKLYAYRMDTRARDPARDVALDAENRNPLGLWSDGETLWVSDYVEDRLFAYRPPRRDGARLSALALSGIDLPFASGTLVYALEVPHEVAATTVAAVAQAGATAAIAPADADAALGGHQVDLSFGADIDIAVAAADGASGTYTVTVRRLPPPGGSLAALHLDGIDLGTLVPFAPGVFDYAHRVAHDVATVTVSAVPTAPGGAIAIAPADADAAAPGHQVDLAAGATTTVTVVAENGGSNTYTVRIHRPLPAADTSLRALRLDHVDFGPFHGARADYAAAVPFGTAATTVTARTASDGASAAIAPADADGATAGHQVELAAGAATAVAVTVTAGDGVATRTYTVRVERAAAGAPGTVPTLPADLTRQNILGHIRSHGIDGVEGLVAALPRLHKLHAVLVYESEALFKDHVSAEHPRVVSWGANADFVLSWATDPDSPGYEGMEFLRPVEGDWVAGVIDFSGPSPRITEPEICGTCHGPLNKPLWGPNNFWDGTEGENETHRYTEPVTERAAEATLRAMRSSDPRLQPLHLIHQGPGSVEEREPRVVVHNGENLHLLPEFTNTLIFQHDRVMFDIVKARPDYPRIARTFMCASFPSRKLPDLFELRDHHMARLADSLAHIQGNERIDVELYTGLYTNGGTPFTFLILHDLWRRDARVAAALAQYDGDIERFHRMMFGSGEAVLLERTVQKILAGGRLLQEIDGRVCSALGGKPPVLGGDDGDERTVTGFTVVDGAGAALRRLREGDVLALDAPGLDDLAIRADIAADGVASVRLEIAAVESGTRATRVSGAAPHTLYYGGAPAVDEYYVSATPYPAPALGGQPGATLTVRFLVRDFESLAGGDPRGLWSDGDTLWAVGADASLLAYDLTDGTRETDRDIVLDTDNGDPRGLWSDGAILWVVDVDGAVYAYDLANGGRAADRDIVLDTFNGDPRGLWSDGVTLWVVDGDGALYAYDLEYGRREIDRDIALDADNGDPRGLWSDGATLWVIDGDDARHYAYDPAAGRRAPERDLTASARLGTDDPAALWTDGDGVWAVDGDGVLRTAVLPPLFPLRSLHLSGVDLGRFDGGTLDYSAVAPNSTARTTVGATVSADAYATIAPADADPDTDGHQVDLVEGDNEIAVTVSSANTTLTYTVSVRRQAVVESFTFVHVPTDTNVLTLREDGVVDLGAFWDRDELADAVNIHANLSSGVAVGSVRVDLTGDATQRWTHNEPPYRIHRKRGQPLTAGTYRISATPFPKPRGQGAAGTTFAVDFTVEGDTGKPVRSFTLVHADSDEEPVTLEDGAVIDIGALEARRFNVHANLARGATVGSVRVQSSGRETRSRADNGAPYSLFLNGRSMPIGTYTVNARAYHFGNASGDVSGKSEVTFTLAGITGRATGFTLVHAPTGDDIAALEDGDAFDLGAIAGRTNEFSIRADVEGDAGVGSVRLLLTGARTVQGVDNEAPYLSWPTDLVAGVYRITAIPYTEPELGGERLPALSADFTLAGVLGEPGTPLAGFTLVDAAGDPPNPDIQAIADGTLLDRAALPSNWFNIRADVKDGYDVGSVHLELTGPTARSATRNDAPHTVFGHRRSDGNYWGARLPDGDYVIKATPYPDADGGGTPWPTATAAFSMGTAVSALPEVSVAAGASPVPEGGDATFTLTRTGPATAPLSVDVAVTETGAMLAGNPTSLTFAANASGATLTVGTNDDAVVEDASTVTATVAPGTGYTVAGGSAQVTVQDDDVAELALSVAPDTIEEGESAAITVEITNGVTFAERTYISSHWSGTATKGDDYALTGPLPALRLAPGAASGNVTVTALDDAEEEEAETVVFKGGYDGPIGTVTVTIAASDARVDDATLSALTLSGIDIGTFASETTAYAAEVDDTVETTLVTATATDAGASLVVADANGSTADAPRTVALAEGANTITVTVTAEDGNATRTYTVTVTRAAPASDDATLSGLTLSGVDIGSFASGTTAYAAEVDDTVATTVVTATASHEAASVVIGDGDGSTTDAPRTVALAEGDNAITVNVTAEDGVATRTYTVTVTRAAVPLTAQFEEVPASHDGDSAAFTLGLRFSEPIAIGYRTLRDASLAATDGAVTGARRVNGRSDLWAIEVAPASDADVTLALPATSDCTTPDAVCTGDGKPLSRGIETTVAGPAQPEVSIAGAATVTEGADATFTLTRTVPVGEALTVVVDVTETGSMLGADPPASVAFGAGDDTATLTVATDDDAVVEDGSTVTATVADGAGYGVASGAASATATVADNDAATFELSVAPEEIDEGGSAAVTVAIANGVTFAEEQSIALEFGGTATKGTDYTVSAATLALGAGADSVAATLTVLDDTEEEDAETVSITADHAGTAAGSATATIAASDAHSTDATLSGLALSGIDIGGFESDTTSYAVDVDNAVETTVVTATATHESASVVIADAAGSTADAPRTVALAEGANRITVTVTAEDGQATTAYTVRVTRAEPPLPEVSIAAGPDPVTEGAAATFTLTRTEPAGEALTVAVDVAETGAMLAGSAPASVSFGVGDGTATLTVETDDDTVVEAASEVTVAVAGGDDYTIAAGAGSADLTVEDDDSATFEISVDPTEIAEGESAAVTVAVSNDVTFAEDQTLALAFAGTAAKDTDYTVSPETLTLAAGTSSVETTLTALDDTDEEEAETVTVAASHGGAQIGTATLTIAASDAASDDATLGGLSLTDIDIAFSAGTTTYAADADNDVETTTVTATAAHAGASVAIADADGSAAGGSRTVSLAEGANTITITVTAEDEIATKTYTVTVTRAAAQTTDAPAGFALTANDEPRGIWSDGELLWAADLRDRKLYAYRLAGGARVPERDIAVGDVATPIGVWSDGATIWVVDQGGGIRAYDLASGERRSERDIAGTDNASPTGLWSDGDTLWVARWGRATFYAYALADGSRREARDVAAATEQLSRIGLWSDGDTLWVAEWPDDVLAYGMDGAARPTLSLDTAAAGNAYPAGLWSDGETLWVAGAYDGAVHVHALPGTAPAPGSVADAALSAALPDAGLRGAAVAALDRGPGTVVTLAGLAALTELDARGAAVADLTGIGHAVALRRLDLGGSTVSDLRPLAGLPALASLGLDGAGLADLAPLSGLSGLVELSVRGNGLEDLYPLAGLTGLARLDIGANRIADLYPLSGLTALSSLRADGNRIDDLAPLSALTALERLDLADNRVADLYALSGLTRLARLALARNRVRDLAPLSSHARLRALLAPANRIADAYPLSRLTGLRWLDLRDNRIADVHPLALLPGPARLELGGNPVTDFSALDGRRDLVVVGREERPEATRAARDRATAYGRGADTDPHPKGQR